MTQLHSKYRPPSEATPVHGVADVEEAYRPGDGISEEYGAPTTVIADWVMVSPEISAFSFRVYCVLRALIISKQPRPRRVSSLDLTEMVPGDGGSTVTVEMVDVALKELQAAGLVNRSAGRFTVSAGEAGPGVAR